MEKIIELIENNRYFDARTEILNLNVVDIAKIFDQIPKEKYLILFRLLPKNIAADVFSYMDYEQEQFIIESITDKELAYISSELYIDDLVDFIEEMPANLVQKLLKSTDDSTRKLINQILSYPDNSAGSIMTVEYVEFKKMMTIKEALIHLKKVGIDKETIDTCYVIDNNRMLEGLISIRKLILSNDDDLIEDVMNTNIISVYTLDDQETVASVFKKYDFVTMPVVDNENRLVGIITIDDIVDIIDQENTEDFQKMAAIQPIDDEYLKTGVFTLAKKRIVWLFVLMISATFAGSIIESFQSILQTVVVLVAFIPMLMNTGGNAGSQSSTLIIRGLAMGEINLNDYLRVLWKELRVGVVVGSALSIANFLRIFFIEKTSLKVSLAVCVSLFLTVILAKVIGSILPIIAKRLKLDPAIMAAPIITTIVDGTSLFIYLTAATYLLGLK